MTEASNQSYLYRDVRVDIPSLPDNYTKLQRSWCQEKLAQDLKTYHKPTYDHSLRVSSLAMSLAIDLGLPREHIILLGKVGIYHDIGKLKVTQAILDKPKWDLSDEEKKILYQHGDAGVEILGNADQEDIGCEDFLALVREHGLGPEDKKPSHRLTWIIKACDIIDSSLQAKRLGEKTYSLGYIIDCLNHKLYCQPQLTKQQLMQLKQFLAKLFNPKSSAIVESIHPSRY